MNRNLYVGFKGKNNASCILVSSISPDSCLLTNSFAGLKRDIDSLSCAYDRVMLFGIDKTLNGSVRIECVAEKETREVSALDPERISARLDAAGIPNCVSHKPTHYLCNEAYWHLLRKFNGNAVLIHIPSMKNTNERLLEGLKLALGSSFADSRDKIEPTQEKGAEPMVKAVIFDVDGTLLNSEVIFMRAWKEAGLAFGYDIPQQALQETRAVNAQVGTQIFRRYCGADFPYMDIRAQRIAISERLFQQTSPEALRMPHVQQVLEWLRQRRIPMAVASSTGYETTCSHLRYTGLLDYFDAVVGGDMVQQGKPAPDIFLKAAQLLGVAPQDCIVVGDTPADVLASSAAGIPVILIPDQVPANEQTTGLSHQVLGGLAELPAVLETLL